MSPYRDAGRVKVRTVVERLRWSWAAVIVLLVALTLAARLVLGCAGMPTREQREDAAGAAYGAELQGCVARYSTAALIDACADGVRMRWGVTTTDRKDGGR